MKTLLSTLSLAAVCGALALTGCASTGATSGAAATAEKPCCDDPNCTDGCDKAEQASAEKTAAKADCDDPNCKGECTGDCAKADCGGECDKGAKTVAALPADAIGTEQTCAVSGKTFTVTADTTFSALRGETVYFCCPGCKAKFDADPSKFQK